MNTIDELQTQLLGSLKVSRTKWAEYHRLKNQTENEKLKRLAMAEAVIATQALDAVYMDLKSRIINA